MDPTIKPGAALRRGVSSLSAEAAKFLVENKTEVEKLLDGIDERRDAALKAIAAQETRYDSLDAWDSDLTQREADLEKRETDYTARVETLATREAKVDNCVRAITEIWEIPEDLEPAEFDRAMAAHSEKFGLPWPARDNPNPQEIH